LQLEAEWLNKRIKCHQYENIKYKIENTKYKKIGCEDITKLNRVEREGSDLKMSMSCIFCLDRCL